MANVFGVLLGEKCDYQKWQDYIEEATFIEHGIDLESAASHMQSISGTEWKVKGCTLTSWISEEEQEAVIDLLTRMSFSYLCVEINSYEISDFMQSKFPRGSKAIEVTVIISQLPKIRGAIISTQLGIL